MIEWNPIETAPQDGTRVLVFRGGQQYVAAWMGEPWNCWGVNVQRSPDMQWEPFADIGANEQRGPFDILPRPTWWMPLPASPTPVTDAFRELAAASGGRWDNIDPEAFVREQRDD